MAELTQKEQTAVVRDAAILTYVIMKEKEKIEEIRNKEFSVPVPKKKRLSPPPHKPQEPLKPILMRADRTKIQNKYPVPKAPERYTVGKNEYENFMKQRINESRAKTFRLVLWATGASISILLTAILKISFIILFRIGKIDDSKLWSIIPYLSFCLGIVIIILGFHAYNSSVEKQKKKLFGEWQEYAKFLQSRFDLQYEKNYKEYETIKNEQITKLENEYQEQSRKYQEEYDREYELYLIELEKYNQAMRLYNNVVMKAYEEAEAENDIKHEETLLQYENNKREWYQKRDKFIAWLKGDINYNEVTLEELYSSTGLLSVAYRDLETLVWLFENMNSSNYDIRYAMELYDRHRERLAIENSASRIVGKLDQMNLMLQDGFDAVLDSMDRQSDMLSHIGDVLIDVENISENILHSSEKGRKQNNILTVADLFLTNKIYRQTKAINRKI